MTIPRSTSFQACQYQITNTGTASVRTRKVVAEVFCIYRHPRHLEACQYEITNTGAASARTRQVYTLSDRLLEGSMGCNQRGPWKILCDGESFLRAKISKKAHKQHKVKLWRVPAKSPDLNPVERFWAGLRKRLRVADLKDLQQGRPVLGKMAYQARVRNICNSFKLSLIHI